MCTRFTLATPADEVADFFGLPDVPDLPPRYNVAPSQPVACVRRDRRGRWLDLLQWGLVPSWATDLKIGHSLINARAETVAEKPAFRAAFRRRRCLIPADGFYGWQHVGPEKQAYHFRLRDESLFALAGLWETWTDLFGDTIETCTVITTAANRLVAMASDRMPVILDPVEYGRWLDPTYERAEEMARLLRPYPAAAMTAVPVGSEVNSPRNDGPSLLAVAGELE
jgi:putative SOS response-associated peptidase YedK